MTSSSATAQIQEGRKATTYLPYLVALTLSAFLLFQIQLILAKYLLPWFGGTPALWTTCMFFFQSVLVLGYFYAHVLSEKVSGRSQGLVHLAVLTMVLAASVVLCLKWRSPLLPAANLKPDGADHPLAKLISLLALSTGASYFILSTTGPLLQSWFARTFPGGSPYRLYSLSNLGSFLALLSYPLVVEPWLTLREQGWIWVVLFCLFSCCYSYCALKLRTAPSPSKDVVVRSPITQRPSTGLHVLWFGLAACGSLLFLATTNQICQNIAVVPLLWILPLSIYLLSLVVCFDRARYYVRALFHPAWALALLAAVFLLNYGALRHLAAQIVGYSVVLLIGCMVSHGELVRSKPASQHLTSFYLLVSLGGAAAGVFVVLLAPNLFTGFWEYQIGLWLTTLLILISLIRDRGSWIYVSRLGLLLIALAAAVLPATIVIMLHGKIGFDYAFILLLVICAVLVVSKQTEVGYSKAKAQAAVMFSSLSLLLLALVFVLGIKVQSREILAVRNFYGLLSVKELNTDQAEWAAYGLTHGLISHGFQFRLPSKRHLATSYYGPASGVGRAIETLRGASRDRQSGLRLGMIGLGIGTLAAYAQPGDDIRFYEINPAVVKIAKDQQYFTYLSDCPAHKVIVLGDARLSIERELLLGHSQEFNLLALDAFSGDAPPVHLLTIEAFRTYIKALAPGGILAVHITNTYVDLRPVVEAVASEQKLRATFVHDDGDGRATLYSDWMLVMRDEYSVSTEASPVAATRQGAFLWTDDYSNLLRVVR
jgi:hypothetical protein